MRENKFRAWDEEIKKMHSGDEIECEKNLYAWLSYGELAIYRIDDGEYVQLKPLQYVGLLDKNDKEIYEGDIVKHPIYGVNPVQYSDHMELCNGNWILNRCYRDVEVIGNIYENSELLEN